MRKDLDAVAAQARKLREWFRAFVNNHVGQPLQSTALADLGTLNRLLARDNSYRQIEAENVSKEGGENRNQILEWRRERRWPSLSPEFLLLPLAEAMGDLMAFRLRVRENMRGRDMHSMVP